MRWTERQLAMLREMGVHVIAPPAGPEAAVATIETRTAEPAPARVAPPVAAAPALRADWLVVVDLDDASTEGDEVRLLANLLRAIGVLEGERDGDTAVPPARRAARLDPRGAAAGAVAAAVERTGARAVLALGKAAAKAALGSDEPIGRLRGTVRPGPHGASVIVSWPPSYLLRQPDEKAKAWADLCLAVATVEGVEGAA